MLTGRDAGLSSTPCWVTNMSVREMNTNDCVSKESPFDQFVKVVYGKRRGSWPRFQDSNIGYTVKYGLHFRGREVGASRI